VADAPRLKPQTVTEILDSSFRLYRENFAQFLGILAILYIPGIILQLLLTGSMSGEILELTQKAHATPGKPDLEALQKLSALQIGQAGLVLLITGITFPLATGALTRAVGSRYLNEPATVGSCFSYIVGIFGKYFGTMMLNGLVIWLGFMFCLVPGILFAIWFSFSSSVVVLEGLGGTAAMGRSKQLSKDNAWRIIGLWLIILAVNLALNWSVGAGLGVALPTLVASPVQKLVVTQGVEQVVSMILSPLFCVAWILLYYDIRIRKEAFDLEVLARSMKGLPGPSLPPSGPPGPPSVPA